MADLVINSLRGGMDDTTPASALAEDKCVLARNVEFNDSMLGERRRGSITISLPAAITAHTVVTFLQRHLPSNDETAAELFVLGVTPASDTCTLVRKTTVWSTISPVDAIDVDNAYAFVMHGQSFRTKNFLMYKSAVDRAHVWDGTTLRRAGIGEPAAAPTGANTGSGTFLGTRYYRVRFTKQVAGTTTLRSEPSDVLTFAPSGSGTGVVVTRPSLPGEVETHWELEASTDNANFYVVATTATGTATATDSTDYVSGYAAAGYVLSADIGDYTPLWSAKFVVVDQDRLVIASSLQDSNRASDVSWTPTYNDPVGVGNDERIPIDTDNNLSLDGLDGGGLTNFSAPVNGYMYATKISAIYKLGRTGLRTRAYDSVCLTKERGALEGSLVQGVDQAGSPCLYALDPKVGPIRIGRNGIEVASQDILTTWATVNVNAVSVVSRAVFYPETRQVHWWVAGPSQGAPSFRIMLQTNETRDSDDGVRRGWTIHTLPAGTLVYAACMFADNIDDGTARTVTLRPFIGTNTVSGLVQRCDTGSDDNGTAYTARIVTRPIIAAGILNEFGIQNAALLAKADATASVRISASRDYGVETLSAIDVPLAASGSETQVIKEIDNFTFIELKTLQIVFTDVDAPAGIWELNQFAMRPSKGQSS